MKFGDLVDSVAKDTCSAKTKVERTLRSAFRQMQVGLGQDGEVHIYGFGKFALREMPDRVGRNFHTGEVVTAAGKRKVRFTPFERTERALARRRK